MKTLNAAMALRGAETGSFTTIDLITCRPETGEAAFFKYGAAPGYVKKGGTVRRITGGALPAGLRGGAFERGFQFLNAELDFTGGAVQLCQFGGTALGFSFDHDAEGLKIQMKKRIMRAIRSRGRWKERP